jgi:sugar phosphate isomerase/epimerase
MQFGIMEMQISALIPAGSSPAEAMAQVANFDHAGHVRKLVSAGFKTIELGGDLVLFFPNSYNQASIDHLAALKNEMGLTYTLHLPLWSVEPSTLLPPVRQGSVKAIVDIINATRPLEPEVYVLHATGALAAEFYHMQLPELARGLILKQFQANALASLKTILSETGLPSRRLAVETIEFPFNLMFEMAESLDLSICLDTGHVLVGFSGPIDFFETVSRCLPRLAEVHLHDGPAFSKTHQLGYGKDHQPLGTGDLDVPRFLQLLDQGHFKGPVIFELGIQQALSSLEVVKALRPQYFV